MQVVAEMSAYGLTWMVVWQLSSSGVAGTELSKQKAVRHVLDDLWLLVAYVVSMRSQRLRGCDEKQSDLYINQPVPFRLLSTSRVTRATKFVN